MFIPQRLLTIVALKAVHVARAERASGEKAS
jgi:hypothetical protein